MKEDLSTTYSVSFSNHLNNIWWRKIHLRVKMLMKLILVETRKHNLQYVYKLQNHLINSNEAKVLSIKMNIFKAYSLHYKNIKNELAHINANSEKIISNLHKLSEYCKSLNFRYDLINEHLKKNLIYICIKPVWQARLIKHLNKNVDNICIYNKYSCFFMDKYLIKRLMSYMYINKSISQCICDVVGLNNQTMYISKNEKYYYRYRKSDFIQYKTQSDTIIELIYHVSLNDLAWYLFNTLKKEPLEKTIVISKKNTHCQRKEYLSAKKTIKLHDYNLVTRYQKSLDGYVVKFFQNLYKKIQLFVYIKESIELNLYISQVLHTLIKKKLNRHIKRSRIVRDLKTANVKLNRLLYVNNLNTHYNI